MNNDLILVHEFESELPAAVMMLRQAGFTNLADTVEKARAALAVPVQSEQEPVKLAVWYGPMPESNGKSNFTAILHRAGEGVMGGPHITIERSEYPDRVRYEADLVRHIIGELEEEPDVLAYDPDLHSGYVKPECAAPVRTVRLPPKRKTINTRNSHDWDEGYVDGWNAHHDAAAQLNAQPAGTES